MEVVMILNVLEKQGQENYGVCSAFVRAAFHVSFARVNQRAGCVSILIDVSHRVVSITQKTLRPHVAGLA